MGSIAGAMGFEPTLFGSTNRRDKPGYATPPFCAGGGNRTHAAVL